jgi:UDP-N-acetylmuramoyl-tripeptide--D-alanyl-D-alanine ligase
MNMNLTVNELQTLFPKNSLSLPCDQSFTGVSHDTRQIQPGMIYIAIKGDKHDGHQFVEDAFAKGAVACLVNDSYPERENLIRAEDTIKGLQKLAHFHRQKFQKPVIAITGSNGKTTTKELLAHVLSGFGKVVATQGNFNNHIGLPLTISRFHDEADFFILEIGMNHFGEIDLLSKISKPNIGIITGIGRAHMENLGNSLKGVAKAKGELFQNLTSNDIAITNGDDELSKTLPTKAKLISFGLNESCDVRATDIQNEGDVTQFKLNYKGKSLKVTLPLVGIHHVRNALAVSAAALELGLELQIIAHQLSHFQIMANRGGLKQLKHWLLVDDTYNANPDSVTASLNMVNTKYPEMKKIAVLGDMLEIGKQSENLHEEVGHTVKEQGFSVLFGYGEKSKHYLAGFGYSEEEKEKHHFDNHLEIAKHLLSTFDQKDDLVILFKGSRGMTMEKVIEALQKEMS